MARFDARTNANMTWAGEQHEPLRTRVRSAWWEFGVGALLGVIVASVWFGRDPIGQSFADWFHNLALIGAALVALFSHLSNLFRALLLGAIAVVALLVFLIRRAR